MTEKLILLTNDDGVHSEGILELKRALSVLGKVVVVAPDTERSGTSHALTIRQPVRIKAVQEDIYSVAGYTSDCVYFALHGLLERKPDLVISGINKGANLGVDVYYSGTLAGIRQAVIDGHKGFAVSLSVDKKVDRVCWQTAIEFSVKLASKMLDNGYKDKGFLNVNCPNVDLKEVKGVKLTTMGDRRYFTDVKKELGADGEQYAWLWGEYSCFTPINDSDCDAVENNYISVTPMLLDLTDHGMIAELKSWNL